MRVSEKAWAPAPSHPPLGPGGLHVWRADLDAPDTTGTRDGERADELLSPQERERAARIVHEPSRARWTRSRAILRQLLGRYTQLDAHALRFAAGAHGKPTLELGGEAPAEAASLEFNLSHSGWLVLYAFASAGAVGIDVELARNRAIDTLAVAARMFPPGEAERLAGLQGSGRDAEFLRLWVRHEAELKCLGVGIGAAAAASSRERPPWIAELDLGPHAAAAAAVAAAEPPVELRCWSWTDAQPPA